MSPSHRVAAAVGTVTREDTMPLQQPLDGGSCRRSLSLRANVVTPLVWAVMLLAVACSPGEATGGAASKIGKVRLRLPSRTESSSGVHIIRQPVAPSPVAVGTGVCEAPCCYPVAAVCSSQHWQPIVRPHLASRVTAGQLCQVISVVLDSYHNSSTCKHGHP